MSGVGVPEARASLQHALADRVRLTLSVRPEFPDVVYVHPDTVNDVITSAGFGEPGDGSGHVHGTAVDLFGVPVIPTHQAIPDRFLWVWHARALPGSPPPAHA